MSRKIHKLSLPALVLGLIITFLFTYQVHLKDQGDCSSANLGIQASSRIQRVECVSRTYGFPLRFVEANSDLDISGATSDPGSQSVLNIQSSTDINGLNLAVDVLLWYAASMLVLLILHPQPKHHETHTKKSKK